MKAAQIQKYSKNIEAQIVDIPIPSIKENEVLVKVKVAAINPLEILNITGSVKLIQDYDMPLTLGNELTGIVEKVGNPDFGFKVGDPIYTRLPIEKIGAFAEYVAVDAKSIWQKFRFRYRSWCTVNWFDGIPRLSRRVRSKKGTNSVYFRRFRKFWTNGCSYS